MKMTQTQIETQPAVQDGRGVLTNSSEQTFMCCPRKFFWSYEKGWRPGRDKTPLRMGSAGHAGVDALTQPIGASHATAVELAMDTIEAVYDQHILTAASWQDADQAQLDLAMECVTVQELVRGYATAWANSPLTIMESEAVFNLPIVNPDTSAPSRTFRQAGRRDRVARLPDGRIVLMETKFIGEDIGNDSDYWRIQGLDQQLSKYILAARAQGIEVQSAIKDVIRKPTIKPCDVPEQDEHGFAVVRDAAGQRVKLKNGNWRLTADADKGFTLAKYPMTPDEWRKKLSADIASRPEYYYARKEIPRLDSDLDEYQHELWWIADSIRQCRNSGRWFRNSGSCKKFNSLCPYYPLCAREIDSSGDVPTGFLQVGNIHQELIQQEEEGVQ
jgi:hypothetical protein